MNPLFDLQFWFALHPSALSPVFEQVFFIGFAILIVAGAIAHIVARNKKKQDREITRVFKWIGQMFYGMGIAGLVWYFFTFELIYLFGARFWFLIWVGVFVGWTIYIISYAKWQIPKIRAQREAQSQFNEYLPRRSRK
ncbi:hypothetical protein KJ766_03910 [Patescibacteria group bacterium]|nr:hypothetical protein [Patescibacteria group bacterium]